MKNDKTTQSKKKTKKNGGKQHSYILDQVLSVFLGRSTFCSAVGTSMLAPGLPVDLSINKAFLAFRPGLKNLYTQVGIEVITRPLYLRV